MTTSSQKPRLILASTSPYRKAQLQQLQIPFDVMASNVDEEEFKRREHRPRGLALQLALAKAEQIAKDHPDAVVIGGDQLVSFDSEILGKPHTQEKAIEQLMQLSGQKHVLITAVAVCHRGVRQTHLDETQMWMRHFNHDTAERYVEIDQPLDCAGAYKIESLGISLFERIETKDHTAITGLPLLAISKLLNALGINVP
ncbi:MAG: septum formation protein Maf [Planctomycetaceae bacterium]|nr:septum formation protein Maf [Planctomycetaceae bacterium]